MKTGKKLITALLAFALMVAFAGCKGGVPITPVPEKSKPALVFQIDEGIKNLELIGQFSEDFNAMEKAIDNILAACSPLKAKYDVVYHVYAHYHYRSGGFGSDAAQAENRLSPSFKHFMRYMSQKGEKVLVEAYSSGVGTHQSSALDTLPLVPINYGDPSKIGGFTMDVDCYKYLADAYTAFYGVRFHELVGSNAIGGNVKPGDSYATGFKVSQTAVEAVVDVLNEKDKVLIWGDHSWNTIYAESNVNFWLDMIAYAAQNLKENLVINYSNNSWDTIKSIEMKPFLKESDVLNSSKGFSVQTWFWQESDTSSYAGLLGQTKWYKGSYMDMPPELMAASSLEGIKNGARVIQYEPTEYFFNARATHIKTMELYEGFTQNGADYSARPTLKRFIDLMLNEDESIMPSMVPLDYYQSSETKLDNNFENDAPEKYFQTTLGVIGTEAKYFDTYNYNSSKIFEQNKNRYDSAVFSGAVKAERINLTFGGVDETLVYAKSGNSKKAEFYYYNSANLKADSKIFEDNSNGEVVDFTTANLVRKYVTNLDNDPDEIIVARQKDGQINIEIYEAQNKAANVIWAFEYKLLADSSVKELYFGNQPVAQSEFAALSSYRYRNALHSDGTRSYDSAAIITRSNGKINAGYKIKNNTATEKVITEQTLTYAIGEKIIDFASGDLNQDRVDEIILLCLSDGKYCVKTLTASGTGFADANAYSFALDGSGYTNLITAKIGTYYKQSLFLASDIF